MTNTQLQFIESFNALATEAHDTAVSKGWSEALEALRHGNPPDDKVPEFSGVEAELADVIIRIFDLASQRGWRVAEALVAKMEMNKGRSVKHGGKLF